MEVLIASAIVLTVFGVMLLIDHFKMKRYIQKEHKARMDKMQQFYQAKLNAELDEIDREYEYKYGHPEQGEKNA